METSVTDTVAFPRDASHGPYCELDELRFFADFGDIRVVCCIGRGDFMDTFQPAGSSTQERLKVFEANRQAIERAAERKILAEEFDTKIWHADPWTWSIVLTRVDLNLR
jgi:hypothetical protein